MQVKRSGEPAKRDWLNLVFGCERPYRARVLKQVLPAISDAALAAKLVAEVWIDSENVWQNLRVWASVWCMLPDPRATMNWHEQKEFAALPERFPIFRGYGLPRGTARGLSWTIDRERAEWFSRRLPAEHYFVAAGECAKERCA